MTTPRLSSIVVRVADVDRSARFYAALGLELVPERHGAGPAHFSSKCGDVLFEIFPLPRGSATGPAVRLSFRVDSVVETVERLLCAGWTVRASSVAGEHGERAVVLDPDGHQVELFTGAGCGAARIGQT